MGWFLSCCLARLHRQFMDGESAYRAYRRAGFFIVTSFTWVCWNCSDATNHITNPFSSHWKSVSALITLHSNRLPRRYLMKFKKPLSVLVGRAAVLIALVVVDELEPEAAQPVKKEAVLCPVSVLEVTPSAASIDVNGIRCNGCALASTAESVEQRAVEMARCFYWNSWIWLTKATC